MTALLLAAAVIAWPANATSRRLKTLIGTPSQRWRIPKPSTVPVALCVGLAGGVLLGIGGAIAGALGGAVGWRRWKSKQDLQRRIAAVADLAETLRALVSELRAGAHPATAAESVAADAPPTGAEAMRAIASSARLGGDAEQAVREPLFAEVTHAWTLAQKHGLPLADVLDAVVKDLDQRARFAHQVNARMAGPRASATVLALLPVLGVVLGEAMGAHPIQVLADTPLGQALLIVGTTLICAGIQWSAYLTQRAVLP
jgi:tight adherence protein B